MIANHLLRSSLVCPMSFLRVLSSDIAYWFLSSSPSSSLLCSHLPRRREGFVLVNPTVLHKVEPITHLCLNNKTLSTLQIPISTENAVKSLNYLPFPLLEIGLKVNSSLTLYVSNFSGLLMWVPTSRMPLHVCKSHLFHEAFFMILYFVCISLLFVFGDCRACDTCYLCS